MMRNFSENGGEDGDHGGQFSLAPRARGPKNPTISLPVTMETIYPNPSRARARGRTSTEGKHASIVTMVTATRRAVGDADG